MTTTPSQPNREEWDKRLNETQIERHISGRHLILLSEREDFEDENDWMFLDDFIEHMRVQALAEQRDRFAEIVREKINNQMCEPVSKIDMEINEMLEELKSEIIIASITEPNV